MELVLLGVALALLLALNAFFVLAEFAIVKVRPTRVTELVANGDPRAATLTGIQQRLDEYLSVCQVGITFASVALGMVSTRATEAILGVGEQSALRYGAAIGASYVLVSGSHIVLGELVPKSIAIRVADRAALWVSAPLRLFHRLFFPALWVLSRLAGLVLRLIHMGRPTSEDHHTVNELRIILDQSQELGLMSFRRLLFMENVFDLGGLVVRDAMRPRSVVKCLDASAPWPDTLKAIKSSRFTRYPLLQGDPNRPVGLVHLKDLVIREGDLPPNVGSLIRPILSTKESTPLETLLAEMQRRRIHAALVLNAEGAWTGFITLEDIVEELVGTIRDEFEDEEPARLADAITVAGIHLGIEADSPVSAVRAAVAKMSPNDLPIPAPDIVRAVAERERQVPTYLGHGIGMPHARIAGLRKPFLLFLRSDEGIPCPGTSEKAHVLFVLLTPAGQPRVHQRLQSIIATLLQESEYVKERLWTATSASEVLEVIRTGEQAVLD
jgi:CBS domain containing-hemolysin-like protein/mannitol/fructose-specific phosphotransferase system IIA component (Ntr-type)